MAYIKTEQVKSIRDQIKAAYPQYKWSISKPAGYLAYLNLTITEEVIG